MNKLSITLIALVFLNNCSFNENSRIWNNKENNSDTDKNIKKVFEEKKNEISELNKNLKLELSNVKLNDKITDNQNNLGSQNYKGKLNKIANFKFSKIDEINQLNFKPIFLKDGIIFFNKKGSIIRYQNNKKVLWKKNHYSKSERK